MAMGKPQRECPWCTICLVTTAVLLHSVVLYGNISFAKSLADVGEATRGWSKVGLDLSESLHAELDPVIEIVSSNLTQVVGQILDIKTNIDDAIYFIGFAADQAKLAAQAQAFLIANGSNGPIKMSTEQKKVQERELSNSSNGPIKNVSLMDQGPISVPDVPIPAISVPDVPIPAKAPQVDKLKPVIKKVEDIVDKVEEIVDAKIKGYMGKVKGIVGSIPIEEIKEAVGKYADDLETQCKITRLLLKRQIRKAIKDTVKEKMGLVSEMLDKFFVFIKPTLLKIGEWLVSFGAKVQATIEGFSKTIDVVQKNVDQIMAKVATTSGEEDMVYNTYTLFDVSQSGTVNASDLQWIGDMYGIDALKGSSAEELVTKYDADKDGELDVDEYTLFSRDEDVPGAMAVVLRAFSKKLAQVAGNVAAGRQRSEVAIAVVDYFNLMCAKNATKVSWVSETLTNRSLPMEFTGSLLYALVMDRENPNKMTDEDVGQMVVSEMVHLNHPYVGEVLELMADPEFFESEGFEMDAQPEVVAQVTDWVTVAEKKEAELPETALLGLLPHEKQQELMLNRQATLNGSGAPSLHEHILMQVNAEAGLRHAAKAESAEQAMMLMSSAAGSLVKRRSKVYSARKRAVRAARYAKLTSSETAGTLFDEILGGGNAGSTDEDPDAIQVMAAGQPAAPETLVFAQFLSWNATQTANRFQGYCMDYMGDSSSTLDSFANQIQAMVKKMTGFLKIMQSYATERGINDFEEWIHNFTDSAVDDVMKVIDKQVLNAFDVIKCPSINLGLVQQEQPEAVPIEAVTTEITNAIPLIVSVLNVLQSTLPSVVGDLKFARRAVSAVSQQLDSIFSMLQFKGPPIFDEIASLYKVLWTSFYVLYVMLTLGILFFGFWSAGWCGGPDALVDGTEYKPPETLSERLCACCTACCSCMGTWCPNELCFWSCLILFEIVILLLFIISIVLTLIGGIKAFLAAGCSDVFFLGEAEVCGGILGILQKFLASFRTDTDLVTQCAKDKLLVCDLIKGNSEFNFFYAVIANVAAALVSFQMVMQSAKLHEQARWRIIADELAMVADELAKRTN